MFVYLFISNIKVKSNNIITSPSISNPMENTFSVPCTEIMGNHLQLFFGSLKIHGNPFLILVVIISGGKY